MNKKLLTVTCCVISCWLSIRTMKAAAPDEQLAEKLTSAIEQLDQQNSFGWTSDVEVPAEDQFRPGQTLGTVRDDKTHIAIPFGPRSVHVVIVGDRAAVTNRDGRWETMWLSDEGYSSQGFAASLARGVRTPTHEATALAASLTSLQEDASELVGTLPSETAIDYLTTRRGNQEARDVTGTVRFTINEGLLTGYVIAVEGTIVDAGQTRASWRKTAVNVQHVGSAKLDLPAGASDALQRPIPKPERRLSDTQESELLASRGKRDVGVHDPSSIVKCDDEYWFFSTGTGVSSWRSVDLNTWRQGPRVFPEIPDNEFC